MIIPFMKNFNEFSYKFSNSGFLLLIINFNYRCTNTKLLSAEKLMYICKDQLGIEREYEQKLMPDGKFSVDGFLCVYDVSAVPNRIPEKQTEFCSQILLNIAKNKKPMIVVATKCDEGMD